MSTAVKEKKPFLPTRKPSAQAGGAVVRASGTAAARGPVSLGSVGLGGEARVHLLPSDVQERKKIKLLKRRLISGVIVALVVVLAAYGLANASLATAQGALTSSQQVTAGVLAEQGKYSAVTKDQTDINSIQAAQKTGTAQEILWADYVTALEATLPAGATISSVSTRIDSPFGSVTADTTPLQGPHIATVTATLAMQQTAVPGWLNSLPTLPGYVDNTLDSVTSQGSGLYTVSVTIHVSDAALSKRFTTNAGATK
jgi:hypothetical protein